MLSNVIFDLTLQRFQMIFVWSLLFIIAIKRNVIKFGFQFDTHGQVSKINIIIMQSNLTSRTPTMKWRITLEEM